MIQMILLTSSKNTTLNWPERLDLLLLFVEQLIDISTSYLQTRMSPALHSQQQASMQPDIQIKTEHIFSIFPQNPLPTRFIWRTFYRRSNIYYKVIQMHAGTDWSSSRCPSAPPRGAQVSFRDAQLASLWFYDVILVVRPVLTGQTLSCPCNVPWTTVEQPTW